MKNGCVACLVHDQQRTLSEIVQQQRRQHHPEPGDADRTLAEVPHVRIKSLTTGHDEEHRAEHGEAVPAVLAEEHDAVTGIDRPEHLWRANDPRHADECDGHEPHRHHRAEQFSDPIGAVLLNDEQPNQDHDGDRNHPLRKHGCRDGQPFDGAEDTDRRRDHPFAVEQGRAEDAEHDENRTAQRDPSRALASTIPSRDQRREREDAALALVVGAHHDDDVFDRDDQDERVEDE